MKIIFLFLLTATTLFAQTNATPKNTESPEVVILRAQLQTIQDYDQKMLNSVYWSLGIVGGVALLLVGFSWFTNYRIYERDKAALTQELEGKLQSQLSLIRTELETNQKLANKDILATATAPLSTLREELNGNAKNIVDAQDRLRKQDQDSIAHLAKRITSLDLWMDYNKEQADAHYWEFRGVKGNQRDRYKNMLGIAIRQDSENCISECLVNLEKLMEEGSLPHWVEISSLTETLDKLPPKFNAITSAIKEHLKKVKA